MPSATSRRGRPKGSGLDDRALLRRIEALLDADPALKPTTAIKALGSSDPSTIRRLRDKLKAGADAAPPPPLPAARGAIQPTQLLFDMRSGRQGARPEPQAPVRSSGLAEVADASSAAAQTPWLLNWYALGLSAFSSTVEAQMSFIDDLFHVPQVESALRHQLLFNEMAKALCPRRSDVRSRLH